MLSVKVPLIQGIPAPHTTPHFMAYLGSKFFANMGGGGGQNCFHFLVREFWGWGWGSCKGL